MRALNRNTVFIVLALSRWDGPYASTSFALCKEIAKSHKVFYIDNPFTLKDFIFQLHKPEIRSRLKALLFGKNIFRKLDLEDRDLTVVTPRVVMPINWIRNSRLYDWCSGINNKIFFAAIRKMLDTYHLENYIFINSYNPFYARYFPASFKPELFIYHTVDDISESIYVAKHGKRLEHETMQRAHFTVTTSKKLQQLKKKQTEKVYYLPNAADVQMFHTAYAHQLPKPSDLQHIKNEIIIYTGHLDHRLNVALISKTAENYKNKTILLVGPVSLEDKAIKTLKKHKNIIFTGKKKPEALPPYLQYACCALIPFKCNKLTESIYPLKINEYLSAGLPVVSTAFSEDIREFADVAYIAHGESEFIDMIQQAIAQDTDSLKKRRVEKSKNNTWSQRTLQLFDFIQENLNPQSSEVYGV